VLQNGIINDVTNVPAFSLGYDLGVDPRQKKKRRLHNDQGGNEFHGVLSCNRSVLNK